jgi:hypothetical protein
MDNKVVFDMKFLGKYVLSILLFTVCCIVAYAQDSAKVDTYRDSWVERFISTNIDYFAIDTTGDEQMISVRIKTNGNFDQLDSMGIRTGMAGGARYGNVLHTEIPVRLIPEIIDLESVLSVLYDSRVSLPVPDEISGSDNNADSVVEFPDSTYWDYWDAENFMLTNYSSLAIDTTGPEPIVSAIIETNGDFSQLDSLGIKTMPEGLRWGNSLLTGIPIRLIPDIAKLESVLAIRYSPRVEIYKPGINLVPDNDSNFNIKIDDS